MGLVLSDQSPLWLSAIEAQWFVYREKKLHSKIDRLNDSPPQIQTIAMYRPKYGCMNCRAVLAKKLIINEVQIADIKNPDLLMKVVREKDSTVGR